MGDYVVCFLLVSPERGSAIFHPIPAEDVLPDEYDGHLHAGSTGLSPPGITVSVTLQPSNPRLAVRGIANTDDDDQIARDTKFYVRFPARLPVVLFVLASRTVYGQPIYWDGEFTVVGRPSLEQPCLRSRSWSARFGSDPLVARTERDGVQSDDRNFILSQRIGMDWRDSHLCESILAA